MMSMRFKRSTLIALIGIPGAGKTTLAHGLCGHLPSLRIVSRDIIRAAMFNPCYYSNQEKLAALDAMEAAIRIVLSRGESVVTDGMCFSEFGTLERLAAITQPLDAAFVAVHCVCPLDVAIERVEEDKRLGKHLAMDRDAGLVRQVATRFRPIPPDTSSVEMTDEPAAVLKSVIDDLALRDVVVS